MIEQREQQQATTLQELRKKKGLVHEPGPLATFVRKRSDAARHAYIGARKVLTDPWHGARRRLARTVDPGRFAVDREIGFALFPPETVPFASEVVADARRAFERSLQQPDAETGKKTFLVNVLKRDTITADSAFVRLALDPEVLAAVAAYLGVVPLLGAIQVFHSDVATKAPKGSQLYHCDGDDVEQVKLFVLCSSVTPAGGPLTVLPAAASERVRRATGYQYRQRLTDAQVAAVHQGSPTPIVGPPGSAVLVDTSRCFHFGSRVGADASPRLVTMIQYQTPYSFMLPLNARRVAPFRHLATPSLPPLAKMVLGAA